MTGGLRRLASATGTFGLLAATASFAAACQSTPASPHGLELIVVADGLSAPTDFDSVRLTVDSLGGTSTRLWNRDYVVPSQEAMLPATFTLFAGAKPEEVLITVTAYDSSGNPLVQRVAQVQVPTDRMADLYLVLAKACAGQVQSTGAEGDPQSKCPTGESCQPTGPMAGMCGSNVVDEKTLPTYMPGQGLDLDAAIAATNDAGGSDGGDATTSSGSSSSSGGADSSSSEASSGGSGSSGGTSSGSSGSSDAGEAGLPYDFSVYQHHKNGTRDGLYVEPTFTKTAVASMHRTATMGTVSTNVYAQPLYVENGPGGVPTFLVVTEQNTVYAINASTGATLWTVGAATIGAPVTGGLNCGNINPLGITGTPVVDPKAGTHGVLYFDAMTGGTTPRHLVYALNVADGTTVAGWPVDVAASVSGFTSNTQNQRGALQLVNGVVFVPYGGLNGDCGVYYGWVVGIAAATPTTVTSWHTSARGGGIWGHGALATDGTWLFAVTGNTFNATMWAGGEAIFRLPALASQPPLSMGGNYYAPANWLNLDNSDLDLGGASAVLVDMPGAHAHLVVQGGKDGLLYIVDRDTMTGVEGSTGAMGSISKTTITSGQITGALAAYTTAQGTYVAMRASGPVAGCADAGATGTLVAARISNDTAVPTTIAWCSTVGALASPMVTTTDGTANPIVWAAGSALYGFDGDTGALVAGGTSGGTDTSLGTSIRPFNTPIAAHGKIAVGVDGAIYEMTP